MKTLLKIILIATSTFSAGKGLSQTTFPTVWTPGMHLKMYTKAMSPGNPTVIHIGTESFFESYLTGEEKKTKLNISQKDLNEILVKFNQYDLAGIQSTASNMTVHDGSTTFLIFKNDEKEFSLVTGSMYEIKDPTQKKNKEAIYAYLNALVDRANK